MRADFRVGQGSDRHRLEPGHDLILGGVLLDTDFGTLGHSDGDALVHACVDSLLGAAGLGDIGRHFPESDPDLSSADSLDFLEECVAMLSEAGWQPVNVDATIRLESIRLAEYRATMTENLSESLPATTAVNVKFKTGEGLGPVGRGEAVEAEAISLLRT